MRKILICFSFCFSIYTYIFGQTVEPKEHGRVDQMLHYYCEKLGLIYQKPDGFSEMVPETGRKYRLLPVGSSSTPIYELQADDTDITILFSILPLEFVDDSAVVQYDPNPNKNYDNYFGSIHLSADTIQEKVYFYPPEEALKKYNADRAAIFTLIKEENFKGNTFIGDRFIESKKAILLKSDPYRNKYDQCRVVVLQKKDIGIIKLYYFYTQGNRDLVESYIKKTAGIIRFQDNRLNFTKYNISFTPPPGFSQAFSDNDYDPGNGIRLKAFQYEMHNPKSGVTICFSMHNLSYITRGGTGPDGEKNQRFGNHIRNNADIVAEKVRYLPQMEAQTNFGADSGAVYVLNNSHPYKGKYEYCKVISLHKTDTLDLNIFYFHNKKGRKKVDEMIANSGSMIQFE